MSSNIKTIFMCLIVVCSFSFCRFNPFSREQALNQAQDLLDEAEKQLNELENDLADDFANAANDMIDDLDNLDDIDDDFIDFSLDIPDSGSSFSSIPDGKYALKEITTSFYNEPKKIKAGAKVKIKISQAPASQKAIYIHPTDHSVQKFSNSKTGDAFDSEGFIDWGDFERKTYIGPDVELIVPLKLDILLGEVDSTNFVHYWSEFETTKEGAQEIELVMEETKATGSSFMRLLDEKYLIEGVYSSDDVKLYSDEKGALATVSINEDSFDVFFLILHEGETRKAKLSYVLQNLPSVTE